MRGAQVVILALVVALGCGRADVEIEYGAAYSFSRAERRAIQQVADRAAADVRRLLPGLPGDLRIAIQTGSRVIPQTGETATIGLPRTVYWTVDPAHRGGVIAVVNAQLRATLFHEWYHLVGEANFPAESLVDRASEGLATAFERDFGGRAGPWGAYAPEVETWTREFLALPADAPVWGWMYQHPDGRRWVGYKVGTSLVDRASRASGLSVVELVAVPTEQILSWATDSGPGR